MEQNTEQDLIIGSLENNRAEIVYKLVSQLEKDPFWEEKFSPKFLEYIGIDFNRHLDNLIISIRYDLKDSPTQHYRYLQNVLLKRGVCTTLIRETLDLFRQVLISIFPDAWSTLQLYFDAGYEGLAYSDPASKSLLKFSEVITTNAAEKLLTQYPERLADDQWKAARKREILLLSSYLADAMEKEHLEIFTTFVDWLTANHLKHGLPSDLVDSELSFMSKEITQAVAPESARRLRPVIQRIRRD